MDNWVSEPAPGEETIPAAALVTTADPVDAGCWVDGVAGIFAPVTMVDIAVSRGYLINEVDTVLLGWARAGQHPEDIDAGLSGEAWNDFTDEVEDWLNDNVAPTGYSFGWCDGDFMLASDATWCLWSGDVCTDLDHDHSNDD